MQSGVDPQVPLAALSQATVASEGWELQVDLLELVP